MEEYIGVIKMFGGTWAPRGWALCAGQLIAISQNSALFSIIGTTYGGDGRETFALPDLRGRVPVGIGAGPGLNPYQAGQKGGSESTTLTTAQIPAHNHGAEVSNLQATIKASDQPGTREVAGTDGATTLAAGAYNGRGVNNYNAEEPSVSLRTETEGSADVTIQNTGGEQAFSNVQPYIGMNYIICTQGIYPSRS